MSSATSKYQQTRWSLADLYPAPDSSELEAAFTRLDQLAAEFEAFRPQLSPDIPADNFFTIVHKLEEIEDLGSRVHGFVGLLFTEDTQNQVAQSLNARVQQFVADLVNRTMFFTLWWRQLDDDNAARLMAKAGDLQYWLESIRMFKPHTLSEPEEKIINLKNVTGVNALHNIYIAITNRYTFKLTVDGQEKELTRGEMMVYVHQADPDLRAQAYQEINRVYAKDAPILGQIYQTLVRDWRNEQITLRKYASPISARNLANDLPDSVIDTLLDVAQKNVGIFQDFFRLKARWLGVDRLRRYDLYAPVAKSEKTYEFGAAADLVFESFEEFSPQFASLARQVLDERHLDAEVRKGKRSGAFSWSVTNKQSPWVLLNYQGRADDVETMAHELGHAIHAMLASDHSVLNYLSNLPLAETASTFGEMMLVDKLLKTEADEAVRRDVLFRQIDGAYATIQRQVFFALFERQAHEMIEKGASVDELSEAYMQNLKGQFGDSMDVTDDFAIEWVSIPHIFDVPFYVYAYAFGQLLVFSLYKQYKLEGEAFKPRYVKILSAGGSKAPAKLLAEVGIDISQASFWQGGFDVLRGLVDQLAAMPVVQ